MTLFDHLVENPAHFFGLVALILMVILAVLIPLLYIDLETKERVREEFCPNYVMTDFSEYYCNGKEFVCYKDRCDYIGGD